MIPQNTARVSGTGFGGQDTRLLRYQDVLAKISTHAQSENPHQSSVGNNANMSDGWVSEEEDLEDGKPYGHVKSEDVGPLLGGFADAESAME